MILPLAPQNILIYPNDFCGLIQISVEIPFNECLSLIVLDPGLRLLDVLVTGGRGEGGGGGGGGRAHSRRQAVPDGAGRPVMSGTL